jgi:prepilin-type N-terminal cleavage/methylation domain-containing protein
MLTAARIRPRALRSDAGFTLIEVLVAMVVGLIVSGALFAIVEVSARQTKRLTSHVQATQLGRITLARVIDELRNGCINKQFSPVQTGSTGTELAFISGVGAGSGEEAVLSKVSLHKIVYAESEGAAEGTLTDKAWAPTGGTWPNFTFNTKNAPTTTTRIGEYILPLEETGSKGETIKYFFKYYSYATSASSPTGGGVTTLNSTALATPLSEANAKETASVYFGFKENPPEGKIYNASTTYSDQVTLSFQVPSAETPIVAHPCE